MPDTYIAQLAPVSPLILADRLITLAQDADRAGYSSSASQLITLALAVFDEQPIRRQH